ncbi:hypothetical protein CROQUDRAFT_667415 [Cronartium quercuum f. sp. fusiforme G11]|uniref:Phospholipid scramblase n=1 Tax=Cronartium quercuum f. sp. fusiforme G11 TaxID=708437 RepID=A0A9P6THK6_9BASI|nr:hypothetical protein CROQUDRAFT_667415 [Cronartium quercuum f. sp. fusiforme G11]
MFKSSTTIIRFKTNQLKSNINFNINDHIRFYSPLPIRKSGLRSSRSNRQSPSTPSTQVVPKSTPTQISFPWTDYDTLPPQTTTVKPSETLSSIKKLLSEKSIIIIRQLETLNVLIGYEQLNKYKILNSKGEIKGYIIEEENNRIVSNILRQILGTHRSFKSKILNENGIPLLYINKPFHFINSSIIISYSDQENIIGECQQEWNLFKRKYSLFIKNKDEFEQFGKIDEKFLSWEFFIKDYNDLILGKIDKIFKGFGREIFTDTSHYLIDFDYQKKLSVDQRAVILATTISIDFDYFSRSRGGGLMPPIFYGGNTDTDELRSNRDNERSEILNKSTPDFKIDQSDTSSNWSEKPIEDEKLDTSSNWSEKPMDDDKSDTDSNWSEKPMDDDKELKDPWSDIKEDDDWKKW